MGFTDNGSAQAELAESWETPDDVTYLFNFPPGRAIFQDGAPVDANAMQLNMEFLQTDEEASINTRTNSGIAGAASFEAVDDVTWRMVNSAPVGPTLASFWTPGLSGALISPNAFETTHTDPVGAGPARPVDYRVGEFWLGEKWDGYWDNEHLYADQPETRVIPDQNNAWAQFLDGEISYAGPPGGMNRDLAQELEADGFNVATGIGQGWQGQWFNLNPAAEGLNMFRDPRLRWAIGLSVDRNVVNDLSEDGLGKPSVCNTSTESWAIREGANYYDAPDLAKAAQLRDAAGFGDGNPVTGDILSYNADFQLRQAKPVFAQLQQAGWEGLTFVEGSESAILDRFFVANDWVTATLTWNSPFDPDATMGPSVELVLKSWAYGQPADGPGTGRASLADYPNDQVLQGHRGDRRVRPGWRISGPQGVAVAEACERLVVWLDAVLLVRPRHPRTPPHVQLGPVCGGLCRPGKRPGGVQVETRRWLADLGQRRARLQGVVAQRLAPRRPEPHPLTPLSI